MKNDLLYDISTAVEKMKTDLIQSNENLIFYLQQQHSILLTKIVLQDTYIHTNIYT